MEHIPLHSLHCTLIADVISTKYLTVCAIPAFSTMDICCYYNHHPAKFPITFYSLNLWSSAIDIKYWVHIEI